MLAEVDFTEVWTAIASWHRKQEEEGSSNQSVQILVGPTADAAAGARSFAEILKCRGRALFNLTPIHTHSDLTSVVHSCQENGEENCFVLVGCGGDIDLTRPNLFDFSLSQVHVVHNVRPFHLNNLRSEEQNFYVWDRSEIELGVDTFFRAHAPSVNKRGRDGEEDGDEDEEEVDPLTGRLSSRAIDWKSESAIVHLKEVEKNYYSTSGVGRSIADTFYGLSGHLKFNDNLYLWNTAVGLADLYLRNLLSRSEYDFRMQNLEVALQSLTLLRGSAGAQFGGDATHLINQAAAGQQAGGAVLPMGVKPPPAQLTKGEEHRPLLLRQWNLWDSLWHEPVIAAKLGTYNKQLGEETLRTLLAEVGVHVKGEAQKPWANLESKRRDDILRELLPRLGEKIGTEHSLSLACLCRNKGHPETSSFDMVRLFNAVASSPMEVRSLLSRDEAPLSKAQFDQELTNHKRTQFWAGYDLLWDRDSSRREGTAFYKAVSSATSLYTTIGEATDAILAASNKSFISFQTSIHATLTDGYHQAILGVPARLALLSAHVLAAQVEKTRVAETGRSVKYRTPTGRPLFLRCPVPNAARAAAGSDASTTTNTTTGTVEYFVVYFNSKQFSKTEPIKPIRELHNVASQYNASSSTLVDPSKPELGIIRAVEQDELDRHVVLVKGEDVSQRFTEQVYLNLQTFQTRRRTAAAGH